MYKELTISEVKELRAEAEKKILDILVELHKSTDCIFIDISVQCSRFDGVGTFNVVQEFSDVSIELSI